MAGTRVDLSAALPAAHDTTPATPAVRLREDASASKVLGLVLLLAVFLTASLSPFQGDTWWQLRAGSDMWASRSVMLSDVYSHTAYGASWVNHEWFAEVVFYGLYHFGGLPLLCLFAAALITGGWTLTWSLTRGELMPAFLLTFVALAACSGWWEARPHAFSLLFIPATVFLVYKGELRPLPLLFLAWANTHGGVLLGFVVLAAGITARTLVDRAHWRQFSIVLLACALAMSLTPLGLHFWIEIPRSLGRIRLYTLDEWSRTEFSDLSVLPFWGIAALYVFKLWEHRHRWRNVSASEAALHGSTLLLLPAAVAAVRNVGPFLMVAVPALTHLWAFETRPDRQGRVSSPRAAPLLVIVMLAAVAVAATLGVAYTQRWERLRWDPVPAAALRALRDCPDNLYNRYDEGGMLLWFAPARRVFLDGRQDPFPSQLVLEHIEMETGRRDYRATFERYGIRCAFLPVVSPVGEQLITEGWTTLYGDDRWRVLRSR